MLPRNGKVSIGAAVLALTHLLVNAILCSSRDCAAFGGSGQVVR